MTAGTEQDLPFTPFHLGPGALFKGIGGDRFSFMIFGGSQVLIDLEPGYRMIAGDPVLHGLSHTSGGALVIGAVATLAGKPVSEFCLRLFGYPRPGISWTVAAVSAFVGAFSHIFLDAIMHADMMPWAPVSHFNGILGVLSLTMLHGACLFAGLLGAAIYMSKRVQADKRKQ